MTYRIFLFLALFAVVFSPAPPVQAGLLEFFFPSLRDAGPDPSETLTAPFADQAENAEGDSTAVVTTARAAVPLDSPHRPSADIAEWIVTVASEAMTFDAGASQEMVTNNALHFDEKGRDEYKAFLETHKIFNVVQSGKFHVRSYVSDAPVLLNEGAVNKRYRWLYDVPLSVSYIRRDMKDYKDAEPVNQKIILRVQVGRSEAVDNDLGLQVERWGGKVQKIDKK